ncbi:MAG: DEAD/DEAH box helicase [Firmicutes bacterium]|nr:DEAD/DEAH box helicase [Bacillota bacterium]MCL1953759.1 DEAD/DEAH box helicase [Bacillota bacterium]
MENTSSNQLQFSDLGLDKRLLDALVREGYVTPSPIQSQAIPPALNGQDILGCAQTGTGKTAAFALPIIQKLILNPPSKTLLSCPPNKRARAVILTPTRELALQIEQSFKAYGRYTKLKCSLLIGGVSQYPQELSLKQGADIIIATPGRLIDLLWQGACELANINTLVLDEADRMLDMGFINDVKRIIEFLPQNRQTLFFTATMPLEIRKLCDTILKSPVSISVTPPSSTVDKITQFVYLTDYSTKPDLLLWILQEQNIKSAIIFCRTKHGADRLATKLEKANIKTASIHGDKSQGARQNALSGFKAGRINMLVATDIAARGIDVDALGYVINYELPNEPETYVHRIGRTGRAGNTGIAISLCDYDEKDYLKDIEKLIKKPITQLDSPYPMTVFVKKEKKTQPRRSQKNKSKPNNLQKSNTQNKKNQQKNYHKKSSNKSNLINNTKKD